MKQSLQLKLSQHLTLTPQLQQSIRLLQLSTLEMNQEVEAILQTNPLLERVEPGNGGGLGGDGTDGNETTYSTEGETAPASEPEVIASEAGDADWWQDAPDHGGGNHEDDDRNWPQMAAMDITLRQHLLSQLGVTTLSGRDKAIVALLIDALDDDGYLTQSLDELLAIMPPELEVEPIELQTALKYLQNMDPAGVGARDLGECLALQLDNEADDDGDSRDKSLALAIARHHLETLAARDFNKLKKLLRCDDDELRAARQRILRLNPRPGADYAALDTRYIVPDVIVRKHKGQWQVSLNQDAMPRLRINRLYADILARNRDASHQQLAGQLQEARWLIKNVQQRFETILKVSQAIVERQRHFFEHGEVAMRPLVLREIAETVGLHESTVSRVTTQKFMMTPRGIFELKYFFGSHVATETGGACSATAIRALIKQLVGAEDQKKPLSDSQITEILANQGIVVARRTIAKYRESLQIPAVNLRKAL